MLDISLHKHNPQIETHSQLHVDYAPLFLYHPVRDDQKNRDMTGHLDVRERGASFRRHFQVRNHHCPMKIYNIRIVSIVTPQRVRYLFAPQKQI